MIQYQVKLTDLKEPYGSSTLRFASATPALKHVMMYAFNGKYTVQIWKCTDSRPWEFMTKSGLALEMEKENKKNRDKQRVRTWPSKTASERGLEYHLCITKREDPFTVINLRYDSATGAAKGFKHHVGKDHDIQLWVMEDFKPWQTMTRSELEAIARGEKEEEIQNCITQYYQDRRPVHEPCGTPLINQVKPTIGEVLKMSDWKDNVVNTAEVLAKGGDGGYIIVNSDEEKVKNPGNGFYLYKDKASAVRAAKFCIKQAKKYDEEANYFVARIYGIAAVGQPVPQIAVEDFEVEESYAAFADEKPVAASVDVE